MEIPFSWGSGHCQTKGKWCYISKTCFPKERKKQNHKHTKITALKDHVSIVPLIPSSRCFGCWNSHQNSCRNVESHLGLRWGCIITHQQQNSQMLLIHFRDRAWSSNLWTLLLCNCYLLLAWAVPGCTTEVAWESTWPSCPVALQQVGSPAVPCLVQGIWTGSGPSGPSFGSFG